MFHRFCLGVSAIQAAAFYLRSCAAVTTRAAKLVKDLPSLTKTPIAEAAMAAFPEAVLEDLKAMSIIAELRNAANVVVAKGGAPGTLLTPSRDMQ
jgi:hypothetical protein